MRKIKEWAGKFKNDLVIAHLVSKHPGTPLLARIILLATLAYALSPIDLIPDFIPVLGILDDLLIVPLGIYVAFQFIPAHIIAECREAAKFYQWNKKSNLWMAIVIVIFWIVIIVLIYLKFFQGAVK